MSGRPRLELEQHERCQALLDPTDPASQCKRRRKGKATVCASCTARAGEGLQMLCVGFRPGGVPCDVVVDGAVTDRCGKHPAPPPQAQRCQGWFDADTQCERPRATNQLFCKSCPHVAGPTVFACVGRVPDELGTLCGVLTDDLSHRCGRHRTLPPDEDRCVYLFPDGTEPKGRCERRRNKNLLYCELHIAFAAVCDCPLGEDETTGQIRECGLAADPVIGRCRTHAGDPPPQERRCQRRFSDDRQCERTRVDNATVCGSCPARPGDGTQTQCVGRLINRNGEQCSKILEAPATRCWNHPEPDPATQCRFWFDVDSQCEGQGYGATVLCGQHHGQAHLSARFTACLAILGASETCDSGSPDGSADYCGRHDVAIPDDADRCLYEIGGVRCHRNRQPGSLTCKTCPTIAGVGRMRQCATRIDEQHWCGSIVDSAVTDRCGLHPTLPPDHNRCQYVFGDGDQCERNRISGFAVRCDRHLTRCRCGKQIASADGLCQACRKALGLPAPDTKPEGAPTCSGRRADGSACTAPPGENGRCGDHPGPPATHKRCLHRFDDGWQCERERGLGWAIVCNDHSRVCLGPDEGVPCPNGRTVASVDQVCRACRKARQWPVPRVASIHAVRDDGTAVLTCQAYTGKGDCPNDAVVGSTRCGHHRKRVPDRFRCRHVEGGKRCESRRRYATAGASAPDLCDDHAIAQPCRACGRPAAFLNGLCGHHQPRVPTPKAPKPAKEACGSIRAEDGEDCEGPVKRGTGFCPWHQNILPSGHPDRCPHVFTYDDDREDRQCPRGRTHGLDGCEEHRTKGRDTRYASTGDAPWYVPCAVCGESTHPNDLTDEPLCGIHRPHCEYPLPGDGTCGRCATVKLNDNATIRYFCGTHERMFHDRPYPPVRPTPQPPGKNFEKITSFCGLLIGNPGRPCPQPTMRGKTHCHRHRDLPTGDDRCRHWYDENTQCIARNTQAVNRSLGRGEAGGPVCKDHPYACLGCGEPTTRADELCLACAPRCRFTAAKTGRTCGNPAEIDQPLCTVHMALLARPRDPDRTCVHDLEPGLLCPNLVSVKRSTATPYRQLCDGHQIPCRQPGPEHLTAMADGWCMNHRAVCVEPGCSRRNLDGTWCWEHALKHAHGTCALQVPKMDGSDDTPCSGPATVDSDHDGLICAYHAATLPPDADRCQHVEDGHRCPCSRRGDTRYCWGHYRRYTTECTGITEKSEACTKRVVPTVDGLVRCFKHRYLPADGDRCIGWVYLGVRRDRCPSSRQYGDHCETHAPSYVCGDWTVRGEPCTNTYRLADGVPPGCGDHREKPAPQDRCDAVVATTGRRRHQCPGTKNGRFSFCGVHADQQPTCVALFRSGRTCTQHAPTGEDTCDAHAGWVPGTYVDDIDPAFLDRLLDARYGDALTGIGGTVGPRRDTYRISIQKGESVSIPPELVDGDPNDVVGAHQAYLDLRAKGRDHEKALRIALRVKGALSPASLRKINNQTSAYQDYCEDHDLPAFPADTLELLDFLDWWTEKRIEEGRPLQLGTVQNFAWSINRVHEARGLPKPFEDSKLLRDYVQGYGRQEARPVIQAHAFRIDELAKMMDAALIPDAADLRDLALVTILRDGDVATDDNVPKTLSNKAAIRATWEGVEFGDDPDADAWLAIRTPTGRIERYRIPNRAGNLRALGMDVDDESEDAKLCGVTILRRLSHRVRAERGFITGPVFAREDGKAYGSVTSINARLKTICDRAGVQVRPGTTEHPVHERDIMVTALSAPKAIQHRDNALVALMYAAGLRRSEAANLLVGDVRHSGNGKGLWVCVRKGKTDVIGQMTPVAYRKKRDGSPKITCPVTAWERWRAAYEIWLGRPLQATDPLFPSMNKRKGKAAITGKGVNDVVLRLAADADIQPEPWEKLGSHGLRAGQATDLLMSGLPPQVVRQLQRRATVESLSGYMRLADPFEAVLGLDRDTWDRVFDEQTAKLEGIVNANRHRR